MQKGVILMEFWYTLLGATVLLLSLPYVRMLLIRLTCMRRLKKLCRKKGHLLHAAHPFLCLSRRNARTCDLYIETAREVFAVKLFGLPHKNDRLMIMENGAYFVQKIIPLLSFASASLNKTNCRSKPLPVYDFRHGYKEIWELKTPRRLLLLCPDTEVRRIPQRGTPVTLGIGDIVGNAELFTMSHMIRVLESDT